MVYKKINVEEAIKRGNCSPNSHDQLKSIKYSNFGL